MLINRSVCFSYLIVLFHVKKYFPDNAVQPSGKLAIDTESPLLPIKENQKQIEPVGGGFTQSTGCAMEVEAPITG